MKVTPMETHPFTARDAPQPPVRKKAAFFGSPDLIDRVYGGDRKARVAAQTNLFPSVIRQADLAGCAADLKDLEVIFSTWGMPALTRQELDGLPCLKAVFYAAGSVQPFARPLLERGILVVSAWHANAVAVAEFTLAQILLANKGYFQNTQNCRRRVPWREAPHGEGNYGETVALLGAGAIGRRLIGLLQPFHLHLLVFDPYLSPDEAARLGVEKVSLEEAFTRAGVVSNHLADKPETERMLDGSLMMRLRDGATFINTGRGRTLDEDGLARVLQARPSLTALLDVTHPEPPEPDSPLYTLPNVHLTSHIAGAIGNEVLRMADCCLEEFAAWQAGRPLQYAISLTQLETMA